MNFVIIGNSWDAGLDNPTSKHQIALKLSEKGYRVLWVDGAGMRRPSLGSAGDRARMVSKLRRGMKPAYKVAENIWRISPLILPLPASGLCRRINEKIYLAAIRRGVRRIGMTDPVLINFLPTIPGVMKRHGAWSPSHATGRSIEQRAEGRGECGRRDEGGGRPEARGQRSEDGPKIQDAGYRMQDEESNVTSGFKFQVSGFGTARVRCIYYCVDRWDQFGAYDSGLMERLDAECCMNADLVIASAQDLYERCRRHNENCYLIPHGVDHAHFARGESIGQRAEGGGGNGDEGRSLTKLTKDTKGESSLCSMLYAPCSPLTRRIGFFGLISEWVDQDLLIALAKKIDNCELVLAGKADVNTDRLAGIQNIRMIGSVPYAGLPGLAGSFDAGIIPFKVNELTRAVNPIKLREMLAAGCPVVSTALPEVEKLARTLPKGAVSVAQSKEEFVECVRAVLSSIEHGAWSIEKRKLISDAVKDQDWSEKVEQILEMIGQRA